jgi:nitroreductase
MNTNIAKKVCVCEELRRYWVIYLMLPLGYRYEENDWLVNLKKVRKDKEDLIHTLS